MRLIRWGLAAAGLFVVAAAVGFGVVSFTGAAEAQEGPKAGAARQRYEEALAQKLGITVERLQAAQKGARDQLVDEALAAGRITAAQAAELKSREPGQFHGGVPGGIRGAHHVLSNIMDAAAKVIGIEKDKVRTGLQNQQSLTQIAAANGVSRDRLKSGLANELQTEIKDALAKGTITQLQADKLLTGLDNHIDQIIDHAGPKGPGPGAHDRRVPKAP